MMKRFLPILLIFCMMLCACGKEEAPPTTAATTQATQPTTEAVTEEPTQESTVPVTTQAPTVPETTQPQILRNPLNGQVLDAAWSGRPGAVVINNLEDCLPHYGTSQADILYEIETESGITRMLTIFDDFSDLDTLGPVRSTRTFFNSAAMSYDAPIFHCGGSVRGRNGCHDIYSSRISEWNHVDQMYNGSYFYRDNDRYYNQGYNYEHTLFTNGEKLSKAMADKGFDTPTARSTDFSIVFEEQIPWTGDAAAEVKVTFRGGKTSTFTYDEDAKLYRMAQYGSDYIDAGNDEHVSFRNVLVLFSEQSFAYDGEYSRSYYELIGSGEGVLAVDGQLVSITWTRSSLESPFVYTLADGSVATLGVGHTYVAVSGAKNPVSAE